MKSRRRYLCVDCKVDTGRIGEYYMLKDNVWCLIFPSVTGMLCIGCAEARLGRRLAKRDFNASWVNRPRLASLRLRDRLTN